MISRDFENSFLGNNISSLAGIDEAGRGPLAGPVVAAAVILPEGIVLDGLNDSKQVSPKKRERLYTEIMEQAVSVGIGEADHREIDNINILQATFLAMLRAFDRLTERPDVVLVDGNKTPPIDCPCKAIVKGDSLSVSIAAASIIAKVTRDRFMLKMHEGWPEYGFDTNKGYPTKKHRQAIREYGLSDIHRKTFCRNVHTLSLFDHESF